MQFSFFKDILSLFYPDICISCDKNLSYNEETLCVSCLHDLPFTHFSSHSNNPVKKSFSGRIKIQEATALFLFKKGGKSQHIIHKLKYKRKEHIGKFLGELLAYDLQTSGKFTSIDYIIPVPIHQKKEKLRGYNQLSLFGKTLSTIFEIPFYENILIKRTSSETQTKKQRYDRWESASESFLLTNIELLKEKHILLIDDIITTGATMEACCYELLKAKNLKISIASMAYTE
jgi:ComF family protein